MIKLSVIGVLICKGRHLLDNFHIKLFDADEGGLSLLVILLVLVVSQHHLHSFILPPHDDVVTAGILLFAHLPLVPLSCQAILPALKDHLVHILLQVLANTPQTHVSIQTIVVKVRLNVIVAELLVRCVLLDCG
jgi:hypothetical protein